MPNEHEGQEEQIASDSVETDDASFTRRSLIGGALAGAAGMGLTAVRAEEPMKAEPKMPIWSGDLRTTTKPQPRIPQTAKPNGLNLIVIVSDTWRADHLGCYGNTRVRTPHLDALAAQSVVFANANAEGLRLRFDLSVNSRVV